jgi:hypothetical protein
MKLQDMTLEQLEERKEVLEGKIKELKWIDEEIDEIAEDEQAIYRHPLTIVEKELKRVNKEIDHWYDF